MWFVSASQAERSATICYCAYWFPLAKYSRFKVPPNGAADRDSCAHICILVTDWIRFDGFGRTKPNSLIKSDQGPSVSQLPSVAHSVSPCFTAGAAKMEHLVRDCHAFPGARGVVLWQI